MPAALADQTNREAGDFPASPLAEALPLHCNTDDEILYANMRAAIARGHELLYPQAPHGGVALLVGGGPSARHDVEEIRERQSNGAHVFALNGAGHWLRGHGIIADALVILDARPHNARFVEGLDPKTILLLASQCDAAVFEAGKAHRIIAWHPSMNGESGIVEHRPTVLIGGSTTVGMRALRIVHVLGFRDAHLYGYDSCYDRSGSHAYVQPENDDETLREVEVAGRVFYAPPWMVRQADDFRLIATGLMAEGLSLHVHGDGLLPEIAREMGRPRAENHACYDLAKGPASFDFITWLAHAEMDRRRRGVKEPLEVAFVAGPEKGFRAGDVQGLLEKQDLLDHVMRPALALFGARENREAATGYRYHYWYKPLVDATQRGEDVPKLAVPLATKMQMANWLAERKSIRPVTITLREARYSPERNSDVAAWLSFALARRAEGYPVVVVRDTAKADEPFGDFITCAEASRDLWQRAALYALAFCNLVTANGPAEILQFSEWPFIEIKNSYDPGHWKRFAGLDEYQAPPWLGAHQLTVFAPDRAEVLEDAWRRWLAQSGNTIERKT